MSEKLTAKQAAEQLLYKPEYAADKSADVKEKGLQALCRRLQSLPERCQDRARSCRRQRKAAAGGRLRKV